MNRVPVVSSKGKALMPTNAPLVDHDGQKSPYIASNYITVFSIFDTATGTISSYRYDTRTPDAPAIVFDQFKLKDMPLLSIKH